MKKTLLSLLILLIAQFAKADKSFEFNSTCQQAYREITQLKLNNGLALIEKAKLQNPDNLIPLVLESYVDFFTLFFNEDPTIYAARKPKFEERIEAIKDGPKTSPFYNFCLSVVYLHKAAVAIKFNEMWNAGWDAKKAYQYIKDNKRQFPTFTPNDLLYGGLQAAIGTIPKGYKWVAGIFGMKGSVADGMKTVTNFVNSNDPWAKLMFNEAAFFYCYLQFYIENKKDEALQFIQTKKLDVVNNHLFTYMQANLALNNKQVDLARNTILNRNKSLEYLQTPVWDFQMGFVQLYQLKTQEAINYFETFLKNFKGKFYVKDVNQKISWCYYMQGNLPKAQEARKNVINNGAANSDADKQALKDAKKGTWPNIVLLKARVLNDGGYNNEALVLLNTKGNTNFTKEEEQLEFAYRVGRINDDLKKYDDAIAFYLKAIAIGEKRTEYYAARAALQIGMIYEKRGDKKTAISYFEKCLDMENHDYKNSLDQRAKSGIARCKGE
jgi:tetratricopeptide (TPR) repeat protein